MATSPVVRKGNKTMLRLLVAFAALGFSYPFILKWRMSNHNLLEHEGALPPNSRMRGAYMNSGSKDAGRDLEKGLH